jgi:hypothetical protein
MIQTENSTQYNIIHHRAFLDKKNKYILIGLYSTPLNHFTISNLRYFFLFFFKECNNLAVFYAGHFLWLFTINIMGLGLNFLIVIFK